MTSAPRFVPQLLANHMKALKDKLTDPRTGDTPLGLLDKLIAPCKAVPPATAVSVKQSVSDCKVSELTSAVTLLRVFLGAIKQADHVSARRLADTTRTPRIPYLTDATVACLKAAA
jgi:hypothetical protein